MSISSLAPSVVVLSALNALLRREPWASAELSAYAGKTVLVKFADKNLLLATICSDGSWSGSDPAVLPDVVLTAPFADVFALLSAFRAQGSDGIAKQIHIQGEAGLAQLLGRLARDLRWDVEADLANFVGDIAAVRITGLMRKFSVGLQDNAKRINENLYEYLTEESDIAVKRPELEALRSNLSELNLRMDNLATRINKLAVPEC